MIGRVRSRKVEKQSESLIILDYSRGCKHTHTHTRTYTHTQKKKHYKGNTKQDKEGSKADCFSIFFLYGTFRFPSCLILENLAFLSRLDRVTKSSAYRHFNYRHLVYHKIHSLLKIIILIKWKCVKIKFKCRIIIQKRI